ncbi:MAG TPA: DUF418 domain-containing protein [Caulobacteraceae bacterium]
MTGTASDDRYISIDAVRGFAVLGILAMNIVGMGMPAFAYLDPTFYGGAEGANAWTWFVNYAVTDGKMRGLFTFLFGASMLLIADRAEKGGGLGPNQTHYRRMFWLLLIGLIHAHVMWWGDILVPYAIAGAFAFLLYKLNPRLLIGIGAAILIGLIGFGVLVSGQIEALRAAAAQPGASLETLAAWKEASFLISPPDSFTQDALMGFGGPFMEVIRARSAMATMMETTLMVPEGYVEAFAQMLIGMGLFRLGFFTLKWTTRSYLIVLAVGYLIALPFNAWLGWRAMSAGFEGMFLHEMGVWSALPRPFVALAHAAAILLLVRSGAVRWLVDRLAAAGRMALSNYLGTSLLAMVIFDGWAFGLYGQLERWQLYVVVAGIWAVILLWSKPWLERFHYGPFEWAWRSLVQWKPQPWAKAKPALQAA